MRSERPWIVAVAFAFSAFLSTPDGSLLTSEQWSDGSFTSTVTHTYDDDFRLQSLQINSETPITFRYDNDGLLTRAGALDPIQRHPDYGFITDTTLGTITDTWTYSSFGGLESYTASASGSPLYQFQIAQRDKLGRITEKSETIAGVTTMYDYTYDPAGRLSDVSENSSLVAHYDYDANGNRTGGFTQRGGTLLSATYDDQDRLADYTTTANGLTTFTYSENGELKAKSDASGITSYTYDAFGNLRHVELPSGSVIDYLIDGRNRRIGKKVNGSVVKRWLYKDQLNPVAELDGNGNLVAQFVYGTKPNVPDYFIRYSGGSPVGTYRIISDHLGSVRLVVDASGDSVVQWINYDEFGSVTLVTGTWDVQPFGFAGGSYDADTGLVRFGMRDYDAEVGRWTAKDPDGFRAGDPNIFGYVANDPINAFDSSGLGPGPSGGPPPLPVPGGAPDTGWKWNPDPRNSRGGSWGPTRPIPDQSQPSASWDPLGHWDVDDGWGNRQRYDRYGNPISVEEAHRPQHNDHDPEEEDAGNSKCISMPPVPWWLPFLPLLWPLLPAF